MKRITTASFKEAKGVEKLTVITAYDYLTASYADEAGVDAILVGDSLGMTVLGYQDTTQVTMADMLHHTKAAAKGVKRSLLIADMPFLSCHQGINKSVRNAGLLIQEGRANAVKIEGGREVLDSIKAIIGAGIPVMGHLGLTPQSIHKFGSYSLRGKDEEEAERIFEDALLLEKAGAFSLVLECIPGELSERITNKVSIPTIGIGSGKACDGQVLVCTDILGQTRGRVPKFVKQYESLGEKMCTAFSEYIADVKEESYPEE